ncbi:MAG: hypothetical protein H6625_03475 [Bdellovibrionaceae bacterium]|nr:hypothetical protein [Pseudobdellovibrionaceae bacterium]
MRFLILFLFTIVFLPLSHANTDKEIFVGGIQTTDVDYHSYYFGKIPVNSFRFIRFKVTNIDQTPLTFDSAYISGIGYNAWHTCDKGLYPQETCMFEIRYSPYIKGFHTGRFELNFKENSRIIVDLRGEAY